MEHKRPWGIWIVEIQLMLVAMVAAVLAVLLAQAAMQSNPWDLYHSIRVLLALSIKIGNRWVVVILLLVATIVTGTLVVGVWLRWRVRLVLWVHNLLLLAGIVGGGVLLRLFERKFFWHSIYVKDFFLLSVPIALLSIAALAALCLPSSRQWFVRNDPSP